MTSFDALAKINLSTLIDAIPTAIFIVDSNRKMAPLNQHATKLADKQSNKKLQRMCGEVLLCIHAKNAPEGCGTAKHCKDCVINNTIKESCSGQTIVKRRAEVLMQEENKRYKRVFLVSASPFVDVGKRLTILSLEDISELSLLRSLLPICAKCKKIRDDKGYWHPLDSYIEKHSETSFTHGVCPECSEHLYGDEEWYVQMMKDKMDRRGTTVK